MRLDSSEELKQESKVMFLKKYHQLGTGIFFSSIHDLSREYVRSNQNRFKYPDDVTADVMADFVIQKGYVEKFTDDNGRVYHLLTEEGKAFVQRNKEV